MAIEIIKQAPATYAKTCRKCGCKFTHSLDNVHQQYQPINGDFVDCPTCGTSIRHSAGWS